MPEEDRYAYTEGLSRGGTLLTAQVEDSRVAAAMDILEENGSVELDEREATWACRKRSTAEIIFSDQGIAVPVHRLMTCLVEVGEAV